MTKKKSIFLLIIVSVLLAALAVASFARFPVGIYDYNSFLGAISLDYDVEGGTAYTLTVSEKNTESIKDVKDVTDILDARMSALGYQTYEIETLKDMTEGVKDYKIRIVTKGSENLANDIATVTAYGAIEFFGGTTEDPNTAIMTEKSVIDDAKYVEYDDGVNEPSHQVQVTLTDYGYDELSSAIDSADGTYYLKISLGEQVLLNEEFSKDIIQEKTFLLTSDSMESAVRMALQLKTGGLKYKYDVSEAEAVAPVLGENTKLFAVISIAAMLVAAMVFFAIKYKGYGVIAALSLIFFFMATISMLVAIPGITVSLAGVFGGILAGVLAIDGLIITIKRITEENALGKTVKAAIKTGYKRSFFPILNTNVIAVVIGLALVALTTGFVRNFAIVFSIGVAISFISTVLISRMFVTLILPLLKKPEKFLKLNKVGE